MRPEYNGVKYYGVNDISVQWTLKDAATVIEHFNPDDPFEDINIILELYNVQQLLESGIRLKDWSDEKYNRYQEKAKSITRVLGKFFSNVNDDTLMEYHQNAAISYYDDFWELFVTYKCYNRVTPDAFDTILQLEDTILYKFLVHKEIVQRYDKELAGALRVSDQTCRILVSKFLENINTKYYLPSSFSPSEYETVFQRYIDSEQANPNILFLIMNAQSSKECPISPKLRLNAKRKYNDYWKKSGNNVITTKYGIGVSIVNQDELINCSREGNDFHFSYDLKWLESNLDYPTILNNFFYFFEMFDRCFRSTLVSVKSQISAIESAFANKGKKHYRKGNHFNSCEMISSAQMYTYYSFLKSHSIDLEDVFKWFFETYLLEEFNVTGFSMKASTATDYVEKCRNLASEMDGILKQYRMYVRDGEIDRELFELESEHLVIDGFPSLMIDKYAYPCSNEIQNEMYLLFSDQSMMSYIGKTESQYPTLFELLIKEKCKISDFKKYQIEKLDWLIGRGTIIHNEDNSICINYSKVYLLKDLYDHDVICVQHMQNQSDVLNEMKTNGDLRIENTLFSIPEKEYLNYVLNKAEYSNGLDLRNKYSHSTYPQDITTQERDYIELLKVMVLVITKINEEFCWVDDRKEV